MHVSASGHAECAHFNIRYPMPLGPGVDVLPPKMATYNAKTQELSDAQVESH